MTYLFKIATRKEFDSKHLWEMQRLRARIFKEKKGWSVPVINGMEIDGYDALDPYYLIIREASRGLCGCTKVLPADGPYMLKDTFRELLYGNPAPNNPKIWELSRSAIEADFEQGFGFSKLTLDALRELVLFGVRMGIERYVLVTTASIERMMRRSGLDITRFGPPMRIGVENAVAIDFDIGEQTQEALFGKLQQAA